MQNRPSGHLPRSQYLVTSNTRLPLSLSPPLGSTCPHSDRASLDPRPVPGTVPSPTCPDSPSPPARAAPAPWTARTCGPRTGRLQPRHRSLTGEISLELGQRREDAEHQAVAGRRRIDLCPLAGQHRSRRRGPTVPARYRPGARGCVPASFQTTSTSPSRNARKQASSPGRSSFAPDARSS